MDAWLPPPDSHHPSVSEHDANSMRNAFDAPHVSGYLIRARIKPMKVADYLNDPRDEVPVRREEWKRLTLRAPAPYTGSTVRYYEWFAWANGNRYVTSMAHLRTHPTWIRWKMRNTNRPPVDPNDSGLM